MLQRIQSVFLLLTTVMALLFLSGEITGFSAGQDHLFLNFKGVIQETQNSVALKVTDTIPLSILMVLIPLISFIAIFLFKNRKLQMRLTLLIIVLIIIQALMVIFFILDIEKRFNAIIIPGIRLILPLFMVITSILAYRGIKKDENLVRSYDRLR